jgi:hypothetical protein
MRQPTPYLGIQRAPTFHSKVLVPWDCIRNSWEVVKLDKMRFIAGVWVFLLLFSCLSCIGYILYGPLIAGIYYAFLLKIENENFSFGDFFKGFEFFLPTMLIGLLETVPTLLSNLLFFFYDVSALLETKGNSQNVLGLEFTIFFLILSLLTSFIYLIFKTFFLFAIPLVIEHRLGTVEAIKLSAEAALANLGRIIILFIIQFLVFLLTFIIVAISFVGSISLIAVLGRDLSAFAAFLLAVLTIIILIAFFIFLLPLLWAVVIGSNVFAYRQVFPKRDTDEAFQSPPPPTFYGSEYGTAV